MFRGEDRHAEPARCSQFLYQPHARYPLGLGIWTSLITASFSSLTPTDRSDNETALEHPRVKIAKRGRHPFVTKLVRESLASGISHGRS